MLARVRKILRTACGLPHSGTVIVGVSGGPDSLCLADILARLDVSMVIAHLNHKLRPEADIEAEQVRKFAEQHQIPFVLGVEDVGAYSKSHSLSIEEAARNVRYLFLFEQAKVREAQAVAVGHTADDQVETVLMHLLRGAGLSGLRGMAFKMVPNPWSEEIALIRPVLGFWRYEILEYCQQRGLKPALDSTNLDLTYFRNRLRHELIPYLEDYNPAIKEILWRTAEVLAGDYQLLKGLVESAWKACVEVEGIGYVAFNLLNLQGQPLSVKRYLMRQAIARLRPGLRNIGFEDVERAISFLAIPTQSEQLDLTSGIRLLLEDGRLWVAYWGTNLPSGGWPQVAEDIIYSLNLPGEVILPEGWRLKADILDDVASARAEALVNNDPYRAWIDKGALSTELEIRSRKPGERFRPLGMEQGSIKISEFMINEKLPRRARSAWPLVCTADEVVWIPGLRLAQSFRIKPATRWVIRLHLDRDRG